MQSPVIFFSFFLFSFFFLSFASYSLLLFLSFPFLRVDGLLAEDGISPNLSSFYHPPPLSIHTFIFSLPLLAVFPVIHASAPCLKTWIRIIHMDVKSIPIPPYRRHLWDPFSRASRKRFGNSSAIWMQFMIRSNSNLLHFCMSWSITSYPSLAKSWGWVKRGFMLLNSSRASSILLLLTSSSTLQFSSPTTILNFAIKASIKWSTSIWKTLPKPVRAPICCVTRWSGRLTCTQGREVGTINVIFVPSLTGYPHGTWPIKSMMSSSANIDVFSIGTLIKMPFLQTDSKAPSFIRIGARLQPTSTSKHDHMSCSQWSMTFIPREKNCYVAKRWL